MLKKHHPIKFLLLILGMFFLSACENIKPNLVLTKHSKNLQQLAKYKLNGNLGYISKQNRSSLNFNWQQENNNYNLRLNNFLGSRIITLNSTPNLATMIDSNNQKYYANDAEQLVKDLTGFALPLDKMTLWIKGFPYKAQQINYNQYNLVSNFLYLEENQTWNISYFNYQKHNGIYLPKKIIIQRLSKNKLDNVKLKLSISNWFFEQQFNE